MLALLGYLVDGVGFIVSYIVAGVETVINAGLVAIIAAYTAAVALLPSMANAPGIPGGDWIGYLNWIYPVGQLLIGFTALVTMWVTFLAVRYVLRLVRAI